MAEKENKKKTVWKIILFFILLGVTVFCLSISQLATNYYQSIIDKEIVPIITQARIIDEVDPLDHYWYPDESAAFQKLRDEKYKPDDFHVELQWTVAHTHRFLGRSFLAYKSFKKFRQYFRFDKIKAKVIEAEYWEILLAKESAQFKDCDDLIERFDEIYGELQHKDYVKEWWEKKEDIKNSMYLVPRHTYGRKSTRSPVIDWFKGEGQ